MVVQRPERRYRRGSHARRLGSRVPAAGELPGAVNGVEAEGAKAELDGDSTRAVT
jgi:hypothetical protein